MTSMLFRQITRTQAASGSRSRLIVLLAAVCVASTAAAAYLLREESHRAQLKRVITETIAKKEIPYQDIEGTEVSRTQAASGSRSRRRSTASQWLTPLFLSPTPASRKIN